MGDRVKIVIYSFIMWNNMVYLKGFYYTKIILNFNADHKRIYFYVIN